MQSRSASSRSALLRGWPRGWRRIVLILLIPAWLITGVSVAARWWDATFLVPLIQALFPVFGVVTAVLLAAAVLTRVWWAILIAVAVAAPAAVVGVRALASNTAAPSQGDEIVMTLNVEYGQADPAEVVGLVRDRAVSTLVLLEITPRGWAGLRQAGLTRLLPNRVGEPDDGAGGSMILSTHSLTPVDGDDFDGLFESFSQPIAEVERPGGSYLLRAVHPYPPTPGMTTAWRRQLDHLGRWQESQSTDRPLVLAGDFNASASHPGFREAIRGLTDAQAATGAGWVRTWPAGKTFPPFVAIDHIAVRGAGVVEAGDAAVAETDHHAVWARLNMD